MDETTDTRDRVIRLETQIAHLERGQANMAAKVDEMHALLQQGRGAKWFIFASIAFGGFLAGILGKLTALAALIPR